MTLSAEQRRKVAEACGYCPGAELLNQNGWLFEIPYRNLVRKASELIDRATPADKHFNYASKLVFHLRKDDATAIEALLLELLGDNDG